MEFLAEKRSNGLAAVMWKACSSLEEAISQNASIISSELEQNLLKSGELMYVLFLWNVVVEWRLRVVWALVTKQLCSV